MMRFPALHALVLIFVISSLSACSIQKQTSKDPTRTGSEGLQLTLIDNLPKEIVVEKDEQPIIFSIDVRNKGAYPETLQGAEFIGFVWFSGYDPKAMPIEPVGIALTPIEGRNPANPAGGQALVDFSAKILPQNLNVGKYSPKLLANVCYRYQTVANPDVCIEPDPLATTLSRVTPVCRAKDASLGTQGAPVAIDKIEQTTLPNEIQFKITIKNVGKGEIVDPAASCSSQGSALLTRQNLDRVKVSSVKIGAEGKELACRPLDENNIARIIDGTGYIICTLSKKDITLKTAYVTPLTIKLEYDYKQSVEKQITINKIAFS